MKKIMKYLCAAALISGGFYTMRLMRRHREDSEKRCYNKLNRLEDYRYLLAMWTANLVEHIYIADYLQKNGIANIAIYGTDIEADILDKELEHSSVSVACFMEADSNKRSYRNKDVLDAETVQNSKEIDAIVVTPIFAFASIKETLAAVSDKKILSLADIVFRVKKEEA